MRGLSSSDKRFFCLLYHKSCFILFKMCLYPRKAHSSDNFSLIIHSFCPLFMLSHKAWLDFR